MRYLCNYKRQRLMISNNDLGTFVVQCLNLRTSKQSVPSFASYHSVYRNMSLPLKFLHCIFGCRNRTRHQLRSGVGTSPARSTTFAVSSHRALSSRILKSFYAVSLRVDGNHQCSKLPSLLHSLLYLCPSKLIGRKFLVNNKKSVIRPYFPC